VCHIHLISDNNSITCIEHLSNELFYEIFEYLDGCDIYKAFSNLNSRFQHLINYSSLLLKIKFCAKTKLEVEYDCKNVIIPNRHRILSLYLEGKSLINDFLTQYIIDSTFHRLQSIVLNDILPDRLIIVLFYLKSLSPLFSLIVHIRNERGSNLSNIYRLIFLLPSLKYGKLSIFREGRHQELGITVPLASNERFSTIEYLVINHKIGFGKLFSLFHHTPRLRYLTCKVLFDWDVDFDTVKSVTLPNLTYLCIHRSLVDFRQLEIFIIKLSSQLQVLKIKDCLGNSYHDADRWQRLIKKHIPHLRSLVFKSEVNIDSQDDGVVITKLHAFTARFWIERQWCFKVELNSRSVGFSIHPYRYIKEESFFIDKFISFLGNHGLIAVNVTKLSHVLVKTLITPRLNIYSNLIGRILLTLRRSLFQLLN
jgi:hypothetical protein